MKGHFAPKAFFTVGCGCALVATGVSSAATWHYLSGGRLSGISSVGDHVWTVGQDGLFFYSEDNGEHWRRIPRFTSRNLVDVEFWDANFGLVTAEGDFIFRTTDNGVTWDSACVQHGAGKVRFLTASQITITGTGRLLWSVDEGLTWTDRNQTSGAVWFADTAHGWTHWYSSTVARSTDGGWSWHPAGEIPVPSLYDLYPQAFGFADSCHGVCGYYAFPNNPRLAGYFGWAETQDGGATWSLVGDASGICCCDVEGHGSIYGLERQGCRVFDSLADYYAVLPSPAASTDVSVARSHFAWVCGLGGVVWCSRDAGHSWGVSRDGTNSGIEAVQFFDSTAGWAVGGQAVLRTSDGGRHWAADTVLGEGVCGGFAGLGLTGRSSAFVSEESIVVYRDPLPVYEGRFWIHRTTDCGLSWATVESTWATSSSYWGATRVFFFDSLCGWHLGSIESNSVRTSDAGRTWQSMPSVAFPVGGLWFASADSGWATDPQGRVWHSTDGGGSWSVQYPSSTGRGVCMTSVQDGWVACDDGLLHTTDGGQNWEERAVAESLVAVHFAGERHGVAVGRDGAILRTTDAGETWSRDSSEFTSAFLAVFMLDSAHAWAVGEGGLVLGFGDWAQGTEDVGPGCLPARAIASARPNPCRASIELQLSLPGSCPVELYDTAGRLVRAVRPAAGAPTVTLDMRRLPAGVYFASAGRANRVVRLVKVE